MAESIPDEAVSQIGNGGGHRLCARTLTRALVRYCDDGFIEIYWFSQSRSGWPHFNKISKRPNATIPAEVPLAPVDLTPERIPRIGLETSTVE